MAIYQELVDFDELFHQLREPPIIINDLPNSTEEERAYIRQLISTRYSSDMLSMVPSCHCGAIKGEYEVGVICDVCKTPVRSQIEEEIEPLVWFRRPQGVAPLINPAIYSMLSSRLTKSGFPILEYLTDSSFRTDKKIPPLLSKVMDLTIEGRPIQRGYNYFVEHFDAIIDALFTLREFSVPKGERDYLRELIAWNRDRVFSDYLPLPNKALLVVESNEFGTYVSGTVIKAIDVMEMLTSIDRRYSGHATRLRENRTAKAIARLVEVYEVFNKDNLSPKTGLFRRHIYATRSHFSGRVVISSITEAADYDEIYIPWPVGIVLLREHLINKLLRLGFSLNQAIGFLFAHTYKHHELLEQLFNELIEESPTKSIPALLHRNPSLLQGSSQQVRITKVKTDLRDLTISFHILAVKAENADFDGDALNLILLLDEKLYELTKTLKPHHNIFEPKRPRKISSNIEIPKPVIATISHWLSYLEGENHGQRTTR